MRAARLNLLVTALAVAATASFPVAEGQQSPQEAAAAADPNVLLTVNINLAAGKKATFELKRGEQPRAAAQAFGTLHGESPFTMFTSLSPCPSRTQQPQKFPV